MVTITSPSKMVTAVSAAVPFAIENDTIAQLFSQFGDARSTEFSRQFIKDNAQVLMDCNDTKKWYLRYTLAETASTDVLFLAVTHKNKVSKGKIKPGTRTINLDERIEEAAAIESTVQTA